MSTQLRDTAGISAVRRYGHDFAVGMYVEVTT
jgi:hypothetical protein